METDFSLPMGNDTLSSNCTVPLPPKAQLSYDILFYGLIVANSFAFSGYAIILLFRRRYTLSWYQVMIICVDASYLISYIFYRPVELHAAIYDDRFLSDIWYQYFVLASNAITHLTAGASCFFACCQALEMATRIKDSNLMFNNQLGVLVIAVLLLFAFKGSVLFEKKISDVAECVGTMAAYNFDFRDFALHPVAVFLRTKVRPLVCFALPFVLLGWANYVIIEALITEPEKVAELLKKKPETISASWKRYRAALTRWLRCPGAATGRALAHFDGNNAGVMLYIDEDDDAEGEQVLKAGTTINSQPQGKTMIRICLAVLQILLLLCFWLSSVPGVVLALAVFIDPELRKSDNYVLYASWVELATALAMALKPWLVIAVRELKALQADDV